MKDPAHVTDELAELDGTIYYDNELRLKILPQLEKEPKTTLSMNLQGHL